MSDDEYETELLEEVGKALHIVREFARTGTNIQEARQALDTLDNSGVFSEADEATGYEHTGT